MFNMPGFNDVYRANWEKIQKKILSESDSYILGTSSEELAEYYFSNNSYRPIEIDADRQTTFVHRKQLRRVPEHQRDSFYRGMGDAEFEYETLVISIPIIKNPDLREFAELRTSTFSVSWSPKHWGLGQDWITLSIDIKGYGFNYSDDEARIAQMVESETANVNQWISWVNKDISAENGALQRQLREFIVQRKTKIEADKGKMDSLVKRINIPLIKTESAAVQRIKVDHSPLAKKVRPSAKAIEDYSLDTAKVLDIISIIDNQGRQFEKTPSTYKDLGEEDLRNIILVGLNSLFEGRATGETFLAKGKTDIYLNINKGNILVSECKMWGGGKLYQETIDQLLGYLTWRHNYGIMITFVKIKNLSKILAESPEIIRTHPSFRTGVDVKNDTHFVSQHRLNQDEDKNVEIHHLFYNLYVP
jgi:hypothetical protein